MTFHSEQNVQQFSIHGTVHLNSVTGSLQIPWEQLRACPHLKQCNHLNLQGTPTTSIHSTLSEAPGAAAKQENSFLQCETSYL
jgi:hypothetical protein